MIPRHVAAPSRSPVSSRAAEHVAGAIDQSSDPEPLLHPNLAEVYRAKVEDISSLIQDPQCKAEAFAIIRGLIDEVCLVPENGALAITIKGELAGILSLCDSKKKPATSYEGRAVQIKMVAGVGFEPTTFRL